MIVAVTAREFFARGIVAPLWLRSYPGWIDCIGFPPSRTGIVLASCFRFQSV
jgi:hypothetical protein